MKKKLSLVLVFCLLICAFGINTNAIEATNKTDAILAEKAQVSAILSANPEYRTMTTATGEARILDANNMVINQIIANVDQLVDVDAYNNGEITDFFGVEITSIKPLFQESWIDAMIEKFGYKFGYLITLPYGSDIDTALETLENNEHVSAVTQNGYNEPMEDSTDVYDAESAASGHYDLIGVSYAWEHGFVGSHDTRIAVIDDGAIEHVEFDNNMKFDMCYNACFDSDYPPIGTGPENVTPVSSNPGHGHKVAGIIGADYGDGGVNGICQNISMMPVMINGYYDQYDYAYLYSVLMDAKVINLSWGIPGMTSWEWIEDSDTLFVVCTDNDNVEVTPSQYARICDAPDNVIVVGSSNLDDTKAPSSAYSSEYVDIFAPGRFVPSVNYPTGTGTFSGTSFATPMVAAAAALIRSHATHLTAIETKEFILDNVDAIPDLADLCVSGGRLAIDKVVNALYDEDRGAYSKGDVNGDNEIGSMDVMLAQRIANGASLTNIQMSAADVDKNGIVNNTDVEKIRGFYFKTCYFAPV